MERFVASGCKEVVDCAGAWVILRTGGPWPRHRFAISDWSCDCIHFYKLSRLVQLTPPPLVIGDGFFCGYWALELLLVQKTNISFGIRLLINFFFGPALLRVAYFFCGGVP